VAGTSNFFGHDVSSEELETVRYVVKEFPGLSREELARTVCELLDWSRATGRLKARECREYLERLEARGVVRLPAKRVGRRVGSRTAVPVTARGDAQAEVSGRVGDIAPLEIAQVGTAEERLLLRELIGRHHYLGYAVPYGARMQYLVYARGAGRQVVACAQFSSAAWRMACRDAWIGWDDARRARQLRLVVANSRLLILPWIRVKNLCSTILSQLARRIGGDWEAAYGIRPVLLETLVDPTRFDGTGYRAANWIVIGTTSGRGRNDHAHGGRHGTPKRVLVYPLIRDAVQQLRGC
jgi:hypothetical protein